MSVYGLQILDSPSPETAHVALAGELDLTNVREVEERLTGAVEGAARLVVDVNGVVFMDSAALHVFFRVARQLGHGGLTVVVDPGAPVERTLDIVGARDAMRIVSSADPLVGSA